MAYRGVKSASFSCVFEPSYRVVFAHAEDFIFDPQQVTIRNNFVAIDGVNDVEAFVAWVFKKDVPLVGMLPLLGQLISQGAISKWL